MSVLVVGSIAFDSIKTPFGEVEDAQGGSASYATVATAYFAPVSVVGVVGGDFPRRYLNVFKRKNIDAEGLQIVRKGKTFRWAGVYHYDMNQRDTLDTQLNVFADFRPTLPESKRELPFVLLGNIHPSLQLEVLDQMRRPRCVLVDTMDLWINATPKELTEVFRRSDVIVLNDAEARQYTNESNLLHAAREIMKLGPQYVVIKKGEHGCLLFGKDVFFSAPAYPLESIKDPTGAGDTFAGGFIGWLARTGRLTESNLRKAVVVGSAMASFVVEDFGLGRLLKVTPAQIKKRCGEFATFSKFPKIEM